MKTIVMTGAAGGVATMLRPLLRNRYTLVLSDRSAEPADLADGERWVTADLTDRPSLDALMTGADGLIHLGGQSVEADWETVNAANIQGYHNILDAARAAGTGRVIFASSNHACGFYPRTRRIGIDEAVRPDGLYGVSKAFGEALGSLYADKFGMRIMSIRIGNIAERPADHRRLSIWMHPEDLAALITIGLEHPDIHHAIVYGASHNERAWWDNATAAALGYVPRHSAEDHAAFALAEQAKIGPNAVGDLFQGGTFCADGFDGDLDRTLKARLPRP
ncbi:UDP-glucose 4-epimerase [Acuticoccus sediminis]|uniref:UDP-glucose 4-epimerase n=1 Tax=Acuticoccus sediminis TaxID=2184697 RepID=A0A8B2NP04_9HYPH|nr:NAD(P)-dependent oxidoreductase [Acuticoccus sediminis]RAH99998.1 UDP-glucose 4-epimerase [Acuticoccus sediminis]